MTDARRSRETRAPLSAARARGCGNPTDRLESSKGLKRPVFIDLWGRPRKLMRSPLAVRAMLRSTLTPFREAVLERVVAIPPSKVVTYADVSDRGRANVGSAMEYLVRRVDDELGWHRVVNSDGSLSGKAMSGQRERLRVEGVGFLPDGRVDLDHFRWTESRFKPF